MSLRARLLAAMDHRGRYQRKASMRVIRLSDSSTELWFTSHSGAPTSLSKWGSIFSARLRSVLSLRHSRYAPGQRRVPMRCGFPAARRFKGRRLMPASPFAPGPDPEILR